MRAVGRGKRRGRWPLLVVAVLCASGIAWSPNRSISPVSAATIDTAGAIALGDTVVGDAAAAGAVGTYSLFVPTPGATVLLHVTDDSCGCHWSLNGPNGSVFDHALVDYGPRWLAPGSYALAVTSTAAGGYAFDARSVPLPQSFATALGATVSAGVPAAGAGKIESPGAQDAYTVSVPSGGASVMLRALANSCNCEWSLRRSNGPTVFEPTPMTDTRIGLAAGLYVLRVRGADAQVGTYSFASRAAAAAEQFSIAIGDTVTSGAPLPGAGALEAAGAVDDYAFAATGGARVAIAGSGCASSPSYALVAPSGRILLRDAVCGTTAVIDLPDATGDYHLRVDAGVADTGQYTLQVAATEDAPTVTPAPADVVTLTSGVIVSAGSPAAGTGNIEAPGAIDVYEIVGTAGKIFVLEDLTTGGCSGLVWTASGPDGVPIAVDRELGCPTSRAFRLPETGRSAITVRGPAGATGTYSFVLRAAPVLQTFAYTMGATVSPNVTGAGNLSGAGAVDAYTFVANIGQSLVLANPTVGACTPIDAVMIGPDIVSSPLQLGCGGPVTVPVQRTGTHAVIVKGRDAARGNYSIRVRVSPHAATALTVAKREGAIQIRWTAPAAAGGSAITGSQVAVFNANGGKPVSVTGALVQGAPNATPTYVFTGLANGTSYRFVVRERNAEGLGEQSVVTAAIAPAANSRPNILFILTDDQRWDSLSQLPKLDAQPNWLRFNKSFVNEPICCPSRATTLTGRYSHHTNVQTLVEGASLDDRTTIATMLRGAGYRTGLIGKYLNGYPFKPGHPVPPGWNTFEALDGPIHDYYNYTLNRNGTLVHYGSTPADYSTDVFTSRAANFLRTADPVRPFFLQVSYFGPHVGESYFPIPAPRHVGSCADEPFPTPASFNSHDEIDEPPWLASLPPVDAGLMLSERVKTCEALRSVDDGAASLIDLLQSIGRLSNTYVVLSSDNGFAFGEHSLVAKGDLFDESIRVPLMVRGPGVIPGTTERLTSNIDLVPTFLAWAKTSPPPNFVDGTSWAANARGSASGATQPKEVLLRGCRSIPACGGSELPPMGKNWGLRTASYKYIAYPNGYKQLFDLVHDPHELRNLANDPSKAALIASLRTRLVARRGF